MNLLELKSSVGRAVFLLETPSPFPCLLQLLDTSHIAWPPFFFKDSNHITSVSASVFTSPSLPLHLVLLSFFIRILVFPLGLPDNPGQFSPLRILDICKILSTRKFPGIWTLTPLKNYYLSNHSSQDTFAFSTAFIFSATLVLDKRTQFVE